MSTKGTDWISTPLNDGDIDGIYKYLGWHMQKAGLSSNCFHYLEVLKKIATVSSEQLNDLKGRTCSTCRWWREREYDASVWMCTRMHHRDTKDEGEVEITWCGPDFCCNKWEGKE